MVLSQSISCLWRRSPAKVLVLLDDEMLRVVVLNTTLEKEWKRQREKDVGMKNLLYTEWYACNTQSEYYFRSKPVFKSRHNNDLPPGYNGSGVGRRRGQRRIIKNHEEWRWYIFWIELPIEFFFLLPPITRSLALPHDRWSRTSGAKQLEGHRFIIMWISVVSNFKKHNSSGHCFSQSLLMEFCGFVMPGEMNSIDDDRTGFRKCIISALPILLFIPTYRRGSDATFCKILNF